MTRRPTLSLLLVLAITAGVAAAAVHAQGQTPKRGGILNTLVIEEPPGLLIHESATVSNVWPMSPCYSNLVLFDPSKALESVDTVIPELADRWSWQDNYRNLVFFLKKNVRWHDGQPFTSRDVKYTFDVVREAPDAPAKLRLSARRDWYANVEAIEAPEPHTVVFRLKRPQPSFLLMLASGYSPVYPTHVPLAELRQRCVELAQGCDHITLVFDKGNNSAKAFATVDDSDFHFVGSLVPTQHPDLLGVPLSAYQPLPGARLTDCLAYRTRKVVFGQARTIVVTYNDNLLQGQLQGLTTNLQKTRQRLQELQQMLRRRREGNVRGGKPPTVASVKQQVQQALTRQWMKGLFRWQVGDAGGVPTLTYRTDAAALGRFVQTHLGKTVLFTDNDDWTSEDIVLAYRSQYHIEHAFRDMKHPHYLGWSPMHHWTDSKIRVHAFSCVLALTLTSLLQRTLRQKGIDLSMPRMYDLLSEIRETLVIYPRRPGQKRHRTSASHSALSDQQQQLFDALDLKRYLSA